MLACACRTSASRWVSAASAWRSWAVSRATLASAWRRAASKGRGSMTKSRSPALTSAPSGATCRSMKPSTRARTSTVFTASVWPTYWP